MKLLDAAGPAMLKRPPSMRARLRAATEDMHQALHHAAPFAAIAEGRATAQSYAETLDFLWRYHRAMAGWCAAGAEALGTRELARAHLARLAALRQDLAFFGRTEPDVAEEAARPGAFAAGVLYTVQGSTLGGKVIHRQLDALLPDDTGRLFFKGSRVDGHSWQILCAALEQQSDAAALEEGALYAFTRFGQLMGNRTSPSAARSSR